MPVITLNLGSVVSAFSDLPFGSYLGEIVRVKILPPKTAGKFAQLMWTYLVIDGDLTGRRQTQFLSLSPNAMGFVKEHFEKFGFGDIPEIVINDDTDEMDDPDLYGVKVIFKVYPDSKDAEQTRVKLVSVEDDMTAKTAAPVSITKPKPAAEPLPNMVEAEAAPEEDPAAAKARAKAERIAAAQAALEAAAAEDDDEPEEAPAPAKPARTAAPAAPPKSAAPVRRTLR